MRGQLDHMRWIESGRTFGAKKGATIFRRGIEFATLRTRDRYPKYEQRYALQIAPHHDEPMLMGIHELVQVKEVV